MANTTIHRLTPVTLTTSTAAMLTAGASEAMIIAKAVLSNSDSVARTFDVHFVPSGGSATTSNRIVKEYAVTAGDTVTIPGLAGTFLPPGSAIHAKGSAGSVLIFDMSYQKTPQAA